MKTEIASMRRLYIIDRFLVRLPKKNRRHKLPISRIKKEDITIDLINIKRIIRKPHQKNNIHDNLNKIGQCLENHKQPKLTQDETDNHIL